MMAGRVVDLAEQEYDRKRAEIGEDGTHVLERLVLLRVIDSLWVEHLTAIDDMRRGIGLRAYSQRDPLNEFKVEAYRMFEELKATIRHDMTHTIFRVTVTREPLTSMPAQRCSRAGRTCPGAQPMGGRHCRWLGNVARAATGRVPAGPCARPGRRSGATTRAGAAPGRSSSAATAPRHERASWRAAPQPGRMDVGRRRRNTVSSSFLVCKWRAM